MVFVSKDESGNFACPCGFNRTVKFNVERHMLTCKTVKAATMDVDEAAVAELKQSLAAKDLLLNAANARADSLASENEELKQQVRELKKRKSGSVTNITNNINVNILAYGSEPLPDAQDVRKILLPPETSVARYIALKHFRDPSTSNLRISNKKAKTIQVFEPDVNSQLRWTEKDRKEMIEKMVDENLDELMETHGAAKLAQWRRWFESSGLEEPGYDKTDAYKRIERDVENMLLSQKAQP